MYVLLHQCVILFESHLHLLFLPQKRNVDNIYLFHQFLLGPLLKVLDKDESHGQRPPADTGELGQVVNFCGRALP